MVTFFDKSSKQTVKKRSGLSLIAVSLLSFCMGISFAMNQASASSEVSTKTATTSVSAKGSFRTATCQWTYADKGGWKTNGYGTIAVKAGSSYVDVIRRTKAGKWVSTKRVPALQTASFTYYAPTSTREANFQLRASDGRYITERFIAPVCYV